MLDDAIAGTFQEGDYDESKLSRLESRWKQYLAPSVLTGENLRREKENVKSLVSDISHQTKTPMTNLKMYAALLEENLQTETHMENRAENLQMLDEMIRQTEKLELSSVGGSGGRDPAAGGKKGNQHTEHLYRKRQCLL